MKTPYLYKPHNSFESSVNMTRCRVAVHEDGRGIGFHQCNHRAKVTRDGIGYCSMHDPDKPKKPRGPSRFDLEMLAIERNVAARNFADAVIAERADRRMQRLPPRVLKALQKYERALQQKEPSP